jgi:carbamoyltransferase
VPVVLNTSFNGPGEPIVESADDAIKFFLQADLDVLYLEGCRISRRAA